MQKVSQRVAKAARDLKVKRLVFGECGHAWRVAYSFLNTLAGPFDFLDPRYPVPQHICEFTYDLIQAGKLRLDKSKNDHIRLTFHDSCNVARATRMGSMPGGQFEIPRAVLRASCNYYFDMDPATIREGTLCCGGGGGLLTDELMDLRVKGASPRMKALKEVTEEHGVTHMAAICAICKAQFSKVLPKFGFDMEAIVSVHQMVLECHRPPDRSKKKNGTKRQPGRHHSHGPWGVTRHAKVIFVGRDGANTALITPHPVLLPMGEGTVLHAQSAIQASPLLVGEGQGEG